MKSKRIIALLLCFALTFSAAFGCGNKPEPDTPAPAEEVTKFTDIVMAQNGETDYKIVVPAAASDCVLYAASELNRYFTRSTGAQMEIVVDNGTALDENAKYVSLGDTTMAGGLTVTKAEVNLDGYKIARRGNTILIKAYEDRGVMYGVYEFLHRGFGYECYAVDEIALDVKPAAYLPDLDFTDAPSFEGRFLDGPLDYNQELQAKLRMKDMGLSSRYGGSATDEWMGMHCESFLHIVDYADYEAYYAEHYPDVAKENYRYEWFSNASGSRLQWCLTNSVLLDVATENLKKIIAEHPEGIYVNIAEEDMGVMCNCERTGESFFGLSCKDSRAKYGVSGTLIRFVNELIKRIEPWREQNYPDRDLKYVTFVYHQSINAPVKEQKENGKYVPIDETVVPHEKLYVRYAPIQRCYYHNLLDKTCSINKRYAENYEKWTDLTDRLMTWEYRTNYSAYYQFFDNFGTMQDETIRYYEDGVINMMLQYTTGSGLASMSDLNVYLNSKILWNVYADQEKLIDDFMDEFYKTGAPYVKEYLNLMRSHLAAVNVEQAGNFHMGMYSTDTPSYQTAKTWSRAVLEKALDLLGKAAATYDEIDDAEQRERLKNRVLRESVCVRYIVLSNYESYYNIYSPDYDKAIDEWEADLKTLNASCHREGGGVGSFIDELRRKG